ncbi:SDR family oxidoreductase [Catenulispora sp. NL8]|uniref:SDR family oxidoreductase n=1 Tax=Catenulispora pinistramenti TaxID=2705254 RepID=A0ABS5KIM9_9ACTN|nr:SDR family oxidoreductase [Catenulispora pinistramenti]MBS2546243.1 SDR family oxidoreductase [Catenulispora pinistramenti]
MPLSLDLTGRVALVTGGARGVGRGVTARLLAAGATVVSCGRTAPETPLPAGAEHRTADVRAPEQVRELIEGIAADHGRLDLVVNNAGGAPYALAAEASPRFSAAIVGLNLLAPLTVAQEANGVMQRQIDGGHIINISSESARRASPGTAVYGAAKAGLENLTRTLAVEWAPKVRVNAITVGPVRTEQSHLHYGDEAGVAAVARTIALGRLAEPDDVGDLCVLLASPFASYVNGSAILLDGGGTRPAFLDAANAEHL